MRTFVSQLTERDQGNYLYRSKGKGLNSDNQQEFNQEWQIRILIKITPDNIQQFAVGLDALLDQHDNWPTTKIFYPSHNRPLLGLSNDTEATTDRDQEWKTVCVYIDKNNQDQPYYTTDEIKQVILSIMLLAQKNRMEFMHLPCPLGEKAIRCQVSGYLPLYYSSYKPFALNQDRSGADGRRHGILMANNSNPMGYTDPIDEMVISPRDLRRGRAGAIQLPVFRSADESIRITKAKIAWLTKLRLLSQSTGDNLPEATEENLLSLVEHPECLRQADADFLPIVDHRFIQSPNTTAEQKGQYAQAMNTELAASRAEFLSVLESINRFFKLEGDQALGEGKVHELFLKHPFSMQKLYREFYRIHNAHAALERYLESINRVQPRLRARNEGVNVGCCGASGIAVDRPGR
jgi:hypothetical protein